VNCRLPKFACIIVHTTDSIVIVCGGVSLKTTFLSSSLDLVVLCMFERVPLADGVKTLIRGDIHTQNDLLLHLANS
jgi:hypothetical protein